MALEEIDALFGKKDAPHLTDNTPEAEVKESLPSKEEATTVHVAKV
jgi:hypothetical protein